MGLPPWVEKHRAPGVEIRRIGGGFYAYKIRARRPGDSAPGTSKKVTEAYLGAVTREGIVPAKHRRPPPRASILEHGNIVLLEQAVAPLAGLMREHFGPDADSLVAAGVLKAAYKSPLKRMDFHYEHSTAPRVWRDAALGKNELTQLLRRTGQNWEAQVGVFKGLAKDATHVAIDLTQIESHSHKIPWLEKGYNAHGGYPDQVQLLLVHATGGADPRPAFLKILPGSLRDAKTLKNAVLESGLRKVVLVGDTGWTSAANLRLAEATKLSYVFALRRNHPRLRPAPAASYREEVHWRGRTVWVRTYAWGRRRIHHFLDKELAAEEEQNLLRHVHEGKKTRAEYERVRHRFGTLAVVTDARVSAADAYAYYKERVEVETAFDDLKNLLRMDKSYMQNRDSLRGYYFLTFIALFAIAGLQNLLRAKKLLENVSVEDVLVQTPKWYKTRIGDHEMDSEIPHKVEVLLKKLGVPLPT